jgi:hypothetical protein
VFSSTDKGLTWASHNTSLSISQFYAGAVHPNDPRFAIAGTQDNGFLLWNGNLAWPSVEGADDGVGVAISPRFPNSNWVFSLSALLLSRTSDGGAIISNILTPALVDRATYAPMEICPNPALEQLLIGTEPLCKAGDVFTVGAGTSPTWDCTSPAFGRRPGSLAFAPSASSCDTFARGDLSGHIYVTTDGGDTLRAIQDANIIPTGTTITDLAFDPGNPNILYATLGFRATPAPRVFKTTNALAATPVWQNITPPADDLRYNTVAVDPTAPNNVYVGDNATVWKSSDGGATWEQLGIDHGLPQVPVTDLQIRCDQILAFTYGRGAFALTLHDMDCDGVGDSCDATDTPCVGDCDRSCEVDVSELVAGVGIALGDAMGACSEFDRNGDGRVTVDELITAVNNARDGCGSGSDGGGAGTQTVALDVGDAAACAGDPAEVTISMARSGTGDIGAFQLDILYDGNLVFAEAAPGATSPCTAVTGSGLDPSLVTAVVIGGTTLRVVVGQVSAPGTVPPLPDGQLVKCRFATSAFQAGQTAVLDGTNGAASDLFGNPLVSNVTDGQIMIQRCGCQ